MVAIIIVALIGVYSGWVIYKKIKDAKEGKFCSCNCDGCSSSCKSKNSL